MIMNDHLLFIQKNAQPRPVGSYEHLYSRDMLVSMMEKLNLSPYSEDNFVVKYDTNLGLDLGNVVGVTPNSDVTKSPILLGAHYDTVPDSPGADDNGAAISIIISVVNRLIEDKNFNRPIILAFFDAEEPPYYLTENMGSINFYNNQLKHNLHSTFIFDLVGHDVPIDGLEDLLFITGIESNSAMNYLISNNQPKENSNLRILASLNKYIGDMSDHHIFRLNNEPYLFFSCGRWEHYHKPTDTFDKLNIGKMNSIAEYTFDLIIKLDTMFVYPKRNDVETLGTEMKLINNILDHSNLGSKITRISSRKDIDNIVRLFTDQFGL